MGIVRNSLEKAVLGPLRFFVSMARDSTGLEEEETRILEDIERDKKGLKPLNIADFRSSELKGLLKRRGYSLRERVNIHGSGLTAFLGTTALLRYTAMGFTDDWKTEALAWGFSTIASLPLSLPATLTGYLFGSVYVSYEEFLRSISNRNYLDQGQEERR